MKQYEVRALAKELFAEHKLKGWKFKFDNAKTRLGYCSYVDKTISISKNYIKLNGQELVRDTLLHEIAHALCDESVGHGRKWRAVCQEIGAMPVATKRGMNIERIKGKWKAVCSACNREFDRYHRPQRGARYSCSSCSGRIFNPIFEIVYKKEG